MGNGQRIIEEQEECAEAWRASRIRHACIVAVVWFILGFLSATGFFYAHFGGVIRAAQQAGAVVQKVEDVREVVAGIEQGAATNDLAAPLKSVHCEKIVGVVDKLTSAGDKLTDMQIKYRAAPLLERMKMNPTLDKAAEEYQNEQEKAIEKWSDRP